MRGNNRDPIFHSDSDRHKYGELVGKASEALDVAILAFCWMTNHVHLAVRIEQQPLGRFVQRVASQYARYLNWRRECTGHVFERRYYAALVSVDEYLLQLTRYIDLNPVKARIVKDPVDYPWCSHRHYLRGSGPDWLSRDLVLSLFATDRSVATRLYRQFVFKTRDGDLQENFSFRSPVCPNEDHNLEDTVIRICALYGVNRDDVVGASKKRTLSAIRMRIIEEAVETYGVGFAEIGRCLNRSDVAISRLYRRRKSER